ncbi:hypothetical protein GWI33_020568 [Rhynchophorus ferrugineus]|uniref:Uncharacterized protein n=1 Tax=Rhynchophorus ferrugineus TaxID=354439 RepID=A0A834HQD0_RHYFE|nr:hypothetical protein GWI33_020568 [Rhynchophorus ferrugineus]
MACKSDAAFIKRTSTLSTPNLPHRTVSSLETPARRRYRTHPNSPRPSCTKGPKVKALGHVFDLKVRRCNGPNFGKDSRLVFHPSPRTPSHSLSHAPIHTHSLTRLRKHRRKYDEEEEQCTCWKRFFCRF